MDCRHDPLQGGTVEGDARLRAALETMLDSVVMTTAVRDEDDRIVDFVVDYVNPVADIGQRPAKEIVGRRFLDVWPGAARSPIWAMYLHLMETGEPVVLDDFPYTEVIAGQPVTAVFDIRATRVGDGFLQNFRDVTERYRMQQELTASEKRFRSAVDAVLYPFFILAPVRDKAGRIVEFEYRYLNRAALNLYQMPEEDVIAIVSLRCFPRSGSSASSIRTSTRCRRAPR
jgi:PAS domain-containing protein